MKVEVRNDSVVVSGYVNAVERWSKPLTANLRGKIMKFIERIKAGTFKNALKRNKNVKVLLNHNPDRELANTSDGTAILEEDNIGLRAEATITDPEVVEKAKNNGLIGWSFGFRSNSDEVAQEATIATRTVTDMDLVEVSILDDTKSPAYEATSIEARSEDSESMEIREATEEATEEIEQETIDYSAHEERLTKIKAKPERRSIDYSEYEERLNKIKLRPNSENCTK